MIRTILLATAILLSHVTSAQPAFFNLDFPGGNMDGYVNAIRQANPQADIIADDRLELFIVPPTKLTNVDLASSLLLLSGMRVENQDGTYELHVGSAPIGNTGESIMRLQVMNIDASNLALETHVWSLLSLTTAGVSAKDALSAIEAALSLMQQETKINFHEQTHLLIVRGTDEALRLTESTLEALESDASRTSRQQQNYREEMNQYEYQLAEAQADHQLNMERLRIRQLELDHVKNSPVFIEGQGQKTLGDIENAETLLPFQLKIAEVQRDLFVAQKRREMLESQLNELRKGARKQ